MKSSQFQFFNVSNPLSYIPLVSRWHVDEWVLSDCVMVVCCVWVFILYCPDCDDHSYLSSSSMFLMTRTLACSGVPFSLINTLQCDVHMCWIFPCFFMKRAFLAMSVFHLVRCSLMNTFDSLSFLLLSVVIWWRPYSLYYRRLMYCTAVLYSLRYVHDMASPRSRWVPIVLW